MALTLAAHLDPDVVVLEASMPGLDGPQVVARMRESCDRKVLALTGCEHRGSLRLVLGMGRAGTCSSGRPPKC
jgi:DNA-binding NarL/FixJ family response regulator